MNVLIGADIVPTPSNETLFRKGDGVALVGEELIALLNSASYRIMNLETPLCEKNNPILKCGPNISAPTETINGYKALNINLLTLANNHILDQGEEGLQSTLEILKTNHIDYVGVGDVSTASSPLYFHVNATKYGVYTCAENEFSIVSPRRKGANPYDQIYSYEHVSRMKENCDYIIVLYHGGKEFYRYPSPMLQKYCRRFIEVGANLVICQHSHCIGCEEQYNDGTIVYGQGNFLFDYGDNEYWNTGLLIGIEEGPEVIYIPIQKKGNAVRMASKKDSEEIMKGFYKRSEEIKDGQFLIDKYDAFSQKLLESYFERSAGKIRKSLLFRIINKIYGGHLVLNNYGIDEYLSLENMIECEAHREVFLNGLKNIITRKGT